MFRIFFFALGILFSTGFCGFSILSWKENEPRAARIGLIFSIITGTPFFILSILQESIQFPAFVSLGFLVILALILFYLPIGRPGRIGETPTNQFDERDIMFARARLVPGSPEYKTYYQMHPENEESDNLTRSKPGLLSPLAHFTNPFRASSVNASFYLTGMLRDSVEGVLSPGVGDLTRTEWTAFIKGLAKYYGALDVGITQLQKYHIYSHIGRGAGEYGAPVELDHTYAIAFTVEMDYDMVGTAPDMPISMESAKQYVESARIAVQLAAAIRNLGYDARAHIDGNYRVICPLIARDAGLGEIGRMGLLMTPGQGPRVRIGVVTTTLLLDADSRKDGTSIIDFCTICKKCADCCPSKSIPFNDRKEIHHALRWQIDSDTCFRYWNTAGTDCGRCMSVCPYAHPNHFFHNLIRRGIDRSGAFRRLALWMDDLFYGRKPQPRPAPAWTTVIDNTDESWREIASGTEE